jgi:Ca2+/H+ antiporter
MGKPLDLFFDPLESIILFLAGKAFFLLFGRKTDCITRSTVITVSYVTQNGTSNWLGGMILICLYPICAITLWYYPGE